LKKATENLKANALLFYLQLYLSLNLSMFSKVGHWFWRGSARCHCLSLFASFYWYLLPQHKRFFIWPLFASMFYVFLGPIKSMIYEIVDHVFVRL